jgi:hypothetical protein
MGYFENGKLLEDGRQLVLNLSTGAFQALCIWTNVRGKRYEKGVKSSNGGTEQGLWIDGIWQQE